MSRPQLYAYEGARTKELLTYGGAVLVHDNKPEMEFLIPGYKVIALPRADLGRPLLQLRDHPGLASVRWPLRAEDFR